MKFPIDKHMVKWIAAKSDVADNAVTIKYDIEHASITTPLLQLARPRRDL
jgi:hypothetical protein